MNRHLYVFTLLLAVYVAAHGALPAPDSVRTVVQSGVVIKDFDVSADDRYVITTDYNNVALWDLQKRKLIREMPIYMTNVASDKNEGRFMDRIGEKQYDVFSDIRVDGLHAGRFFVIPPKGEYCSVRDIFSGDIVGKRKVRSLPPKRRFATAIAMRPEYGRLRLVPYSSRREVGALDGAPMPRAGQMSVSADDSLLLVSGLTPRIWDLRNATLAGVIPYREYVAKRFGVSADTVGNVISRSPIDGKFDASGNVVICGYTPELTMWRPDGVMAGYSPLDGEAVAFSFQMRGSDVALGTSLGLMAGKSDAIRRLADEPAYRKTMDEMYRRAVESDKLGVIKQPLKYVHKVSPILSDGSFFTAHDMGGLCRYAAGKYTMVCQYMGSDERSEKSAYVAPVLPVTEIAVDMDQSTLGIGTELGGLYTAPVASPARQTKYDTRGVFDGGRVGAVAFLPGGYVAAGSSNNTIGFWQVGRERCVGASDIHSAEIVDIALSNDGKRFFSVDNKGHVVVWDAGARTPIVSIYPLGETDYIFITPDNYYMGSHGVYDYVHFVKGTEVYGFDQFDLKFNRPDIVLERLGASPERVEAYRRAWLKRVRKMGFEPEALSAELHAPTVELTPLPMMTDKPVVTLGIKAKDTAYKLERLMISVNGVPIEGRRGRDVSDRGVSVLSVDEPIQLATGNNVIKVSVINDRGVESYKAEAQIWRENPRYTRNLYLAVVGVSDYADSAYNLKFAVKDADDFMKLALDHVKNIGGEIHTLKLTDAQVTREGLAALDGFFAKAGRDDVAILFYAGHGLLDAEMDYYLATADVDFNDPATRGWSYDAFEDVMDGIGPLVKFCFIDACHSGEVDKDDFLADNTRSVAGGTITFRAAGPSVKARSSAALSTRRMLKDLFVDYRLGTGATVFSSSDGMEVSIEGGGVNNGLFTYAIKKGVTDGSADANHDNEVTMAELSEYVSREVSTLSGGVQTPGMRVHNRQQDFKLFSK